MRSVIQRWLARGPRPAAETEIVLGEDWVEPESASDSDSDSDPEAVIPRTQPRFLGINSSPIARKIITFNLLSLLVLVAGVLYLNPFRESLVSQREVGLITEAELIASLFVSAASDFDRIETREDVDALADVVLDDLELRGSTDVFIFEPSGTLVATTVGRAQRRMPEPVVHVLDDRDEPLITGLLNSLWSGLANTFGPSSAPRHVIAELAFVTQVVPDATLGLTRVQTGYNMDGRLSLSAATPVTVDDMIVAIVALSSGEAAIDQLVRAEREQVLQMFFVAIAVSIGLSFVLASTIANPLSELAAAAEVGRERHARKMSPTRVRIPDLTARPDEIGRLSGAMRGMVAALYDRIEANEQFAADVAHEIKNPLASLRSAVASLRVAPREDQRHQLLDVIEHDVRRLDRLISDISNASRLDSELVKEEEEPFNLVKLLKNISSYFRDESAAKKVDLVTDLPEEAITVIGLEARLAQVFVNIIQNAVSFCGEGDTVRVWTRRRENRVLVVIEDTGPGIPEEALQKVFTRFYSERPVGQFGNHSGLGLAISKQIIEAHGGVIWAENIRADETDKTLPPLGARFVVGLPV